MNTTTTSSNQRRDLYTRVTERVVVDLERAARPWLKPWTSGAHRRSGRGAPSPKAGPGFERRSAVRLH